MVIADVDIIRMSDELVHNVYTSIYTSCNLQIR